MPFVNVRTARGLLDDARKKELQERLTDLLVEIEGRGDPAFRPLVWVLVEELDPESWCIGGMPVTGATIAQLRGGSPEIAAGKSGWRT